MFDASGLESGIYEAEIHFTSQPNVGIPIIDVTMSVYFGDFYPCNLQSEVNCTNIELSWEMCPSGAPDPDSYNIYRDDELIANVAEMYFTDSVMHPNTAYEYKVSASYGTGVTNFSPIEEVNFPFPENLEPLNLNFTFSGEDIVLSWNTPDACLEPIGYNVYRDNIQLNTYLILDTTVYMAFGNHSFHVTAVYYFGESGPSNTVVITDVEKVIESETRIFPNPTEDRIYIYSPAKIRTVNLFNPAGHSILSKRYNRKQIQVDLSMLDPGIYLLTLDTDSGSVEHKIVVR
jgi:hypothetical protein